MNLQPVAKQVDNREIDVMLDGKSWQVSRAVFEKLFANSVVHARAPYRRALETSQISYADLVDLARKAEIPHPLFFAPLEFVEAQIYAKTARLLQGVRADTFTINTRAVIEIRDIELIVKDLLRKQQLVRDADSTLQKNRIVKLLRNSRLNLKEEASALVDALGLDLVAFRNTSNKSDALEFLIEVLEGNQIFVARSVRGYMPQLINVKFSGMSVRDTKVPYIFLTGGDHGDFQEPIGRQVFTLMLMTVLLARGIFAPVSFDASTLAPHPGRDYDVVGEILMPVRDVGGLRLDGLKAVKDAANTFKITPSALVVRALRLGFMDRDTALDYLEQLRVEFQSQGKPKSRQPKPVNAVKKYGSRALVSRMLRAVDRGSLSVGEFCRVVCLNKIHPSDIPELRAAVR